VSLRAQEAVVAFDPARVTTEQMIEAVNRLGFRSSVKVTPSTPAPPPGR